MPPIFLLAAVGLDWVIERSGGVMIVGWASLVILLAWRIAIFTFLPQYPFGDSYRRFDNHESVTSVAEYYQTKLSLVREIPAEGTVIYANAFRHLQYYMPQYRAFSPPSLYRSDPGIVKSIISVENGSQETWNKIDVTTLVPPETERIVFFDLPPEILLVDSSWIKERTANGYSIQVISIPTTASALWTREGLTIDTHE